MVIRSTAGNCFGALPIEQFSGTWRVQGRRHMGSEKPSPSHKSEKQKKTISESKLKLCTLDNEFVKRLG